MYLFIVSFVLLVPFLGLLIYKQNGKKEIFRLDVVQFAYLFIFMPATFIIAKAVLFFLLNNDSDSLVSPKEAFLIDTTFSVVCFYLFSAVSIHSLTKTFWLRKNDDPDFDVFHLSEYFHLWWSHIVMNMGGMIALTILSTINIFAPIDIGTQKPQLILAIIAGIISGVMLFLMFWSQDPKQERKRFMRLMKLFLIGLSLYHVLFYFIFEPKFSMSFVVFWFMLSLFISATITSFSFVRSSKARSLREKIVHEGWGNNIQLSEVEEKKKDTE